VITDHNTIAGARVTQELDPQRVIVGEEIMTQAGELLAAYVQEELPPGLPAVETIRRLRDQGAFISVSHPFDTTRRGHWQLPALLEIAPLVDAIEIFNARCFSPRANELAKQFAVEHRLPGTAGSDAHTVFELGRASMLLPEFHDAPGLRKVLPQARIDARLSSPLVHFTSRYAVWVKQLTRQKQAGSQSRS
jgi:predicted metal-dependent phosphoesterase TrpH